MNENAFSRPRFTDGMLLCAADLEAQSAYEDGKRRLLNRAFFGHGVVYGLRVRQSGDSVIISAGLALDRMGREIYLPEAVIAKLSALFGAEGPQAGTWKICLEYAENTVGQKELALPDPAHPGSAPDRVLESFRLSAKATDEQSICIALLQTEKRDGVWKIVSVTPAGSFLPARAVPQAGARTSASGEIVINLRQRPAGNGIYYSPEIAHGLGSGKVFVILAVRGWQDGSECLVTGDLGLFGAQIRCAAKAFPERGTFVAAVQCSEAISQYLRVEWYAERAGLTDSGGAAGAPADFPANAEVCKGTVKPDGLLRWSEIPVEPPLAERIAEPFRLRPTIVRLRPWEQVRFEPVPKGKYSFCVCEKGGGFVTADGWYTAPGQMGIFHVAAQSMELPGEKVISTVLVRDGEAGG